MTIDEAIERYTSNAEYERTHGNLQGCLEFRQLAEWLKELKTYRETQVTDAVDRVTIKEYLESFGKVTNVVTKENNNEQMEFPDTWKEFEEYYGFYDTEEVYTNNSRLIPSFRVKQWLEHQMTAEDYRQRMMQAFHKADCGELIAVCVLPTEKEFEHLEWLLKNHYKESCDDAIRRQDLREPRFIIAENDYQKGWNDALESVYENAPSIHTQPKRGHCKDCKHFEYDSMAKVNGIPLIVAHEICKRWGDGCKTWEDGYCFLFEPKMQEVEE